MALVAGDRSETILDSITDGVFTVDADWRITFFNRAAERITGVSRQFARDVRTRPRARAGGVVGREPILRARATEWPTLADSRWLPSSSSAAWRRGELSTARRATQADTFGLAATRVISARLMHRALPAGQTRQLSAAIRFHGRDDGLGTVALAESWSERRVLNTCLDLGFRAVLADLEERRFL